MALNITPDATSNGLATSATSLTVSHTCTTNTNRVLWVTIIGSLSGSDQITGVTYAGVSMTLIQRIQISGNRWSDLWKLIAPASGTNNIVATSATADRIELYSASYYNVQQSIIPNSVVTNTTLASTSITATTESFANGSWLIAAFNPAGSFTSVGSGAFARSTTSQGGGIYDSNTPYNTSSQSMTINMQADPTTIMLATMEPVSTVLTDGLMSYYKLDGNNTDAVGNSTSTDTSITYSVANGKIIQGAGFNGSSSNITSPSAALAFTGTISVSCWVNPTALPSTGNIIDILARTTNSAGFYGWDLRLRDDAGAQQLEWALTNTSSINTFVTINTTLPTSTWSHLVGTYDGTTARLYLNGIQIGSTTGSWNGLGTNNFYIGAVNYNAGVTRFFNGDIDEVGIWSRPLTASEITTIYNNGIGLQYPFYQGNFLQFF
jgi:hypothetical protein